MLFFACTAKRWHFDAVSICSAFQEVATPEMYQYDMEY